MIGLPLLTAALVSAAVASGPAHAPAVARGADLRIVPAPRSLTLGDGAFALRGDLTIATSGDRDDVFAAGLLKDEIESASAARVRLAQGASGDIVLGRDASLADAGDEGYRIEVKPGAIRITARTAAGVFYGVQTLRQMVHADGIPAATIADRPALRWRGLQDDVSRGPVPTLETLDRRVRIAAEYKINLYALYFETAFAYRSQPLIAPLGGAITPAELEALTAYAAKYHVAVMAEQQSLGHLQKLLAWERYKPLAETDGSGTLSPANAGTYAMLDSMYREIAPATSAPFVHVGGDEPADLGMGQSRATVQSAGLAPTYFKHIRRLHDLLAPLGKRTMVWGDVAIKNPELIPRLGKDFVVATWEYLAHDTYAPWITPFANAKVEFLVCPGVNNWNRLFPNLDQAIPDIRVFTREGQQTGAIGQLDCSWADNGDALFGLVWYPALYGAAAAWQDGDCDPERFARAFDWAFFRNPGDEAAQAVRRMNAAHALISQARPSDATLEVFWLNPARSNLDRQLTAMLDPVGVPLRAGEEEAFELIARARQRSTRNADVLDTYAFAARRLHAIGERAIAGKRLRELYGQALAAQDVKERSNQVVALVGQILDVLAQCRQTSAELKTEHERLWLADNRPYWLANISAEYEQDLNVWVNKSDELRAYGLMFRNGRRLPPAEQVGLGP
ncbi:MAG: beta-N-acetylhexosaminidase [Candidatus Eisenbacteria bacterium]|nr:beta-N-acetylhexosaminidase [Candidatus Eisenbacteria bacterium]